MMVDGWTAKQLLEKSIRARKTYQEAMEEIRDKGMPPEEILQIEEVKSAMRSMAKATGVALGKAIEELREIMEEYTTIVFCTDDAGDLVFFHWTYDERVRNLKTDTVHDAGIREDVYEYTRTQKVFKREKWLVVHGAYGSTSEYKIHGWRTWDNEEFARS